MRNLAVIIVIGICLTIAVSAQTTQTKSIVRNGNSVKSTSLHRHYITGRIGGCYYLKGKNKIMVDRGNCM